MRIGMNRVNYRNIISIIVMAVMVITLVPVNSVSAAENTCGDNLTWKVEGEKLYIEGHGEMEDYLQGEAPWSDNSISIASVVLDEGIASIGENAFYGKGIQYIFYKGSKEQWNQVDIRDSRTLLIIENGGIHFSSFDHSWGEWSSEDEYLKNRIECIGGKSSRICKVCCAEETKDIEGKGCDYVAFVDGEYYGEVFVPECTRCKEYWWGPENGEEDPFFGNTYDTQYDADERRCFRIAVYLNNTSFTETGKEHKPGVSAFIREYIYNYNDETYEDEYELVSQEKFPEKYYDVIYSGNGTSAGKHSVTVRFKDKYSGKIVKYYNVYKSPIVSTKIDMYKGKTYNAKRSDATGAIQWKTSSKRIATVSSTGTIKAKKYGKCKLYAKYKGKTYTSQIVIPHHKPSYEACLDEYDRRTGKVYVYVKNKGRVPLYVYSKGSKLIDFDYKYYDRTLGLSGKKKYVKINPGKEKCLVYRIKGRATWPGVEDKKIRMKFKYEGKYYTRYAY